MIKVILIFGMIATFPGFGMILGGLYSNSINNGSAVDWQPLVEPPADVIGLLDGDIDGVYIRVKPNSVYYCQRAFSSENRDCWIEVTPPVPRNDDPYEITPPDFRVKPPPGDEIERISYGYRFQEGAVRVDYALLADGIIWEWRHGSNAQTMIFYGFIGFVAGTAIAVLISTAIVVQEVYRRKQIRKTSVILDRQSDS